MTEPSSTTSVRADFFDYVPFRAQLTLYSAIFFTFSVIGFLFDLGSSGVRRPFLRVLLWAGLSGLVATLWATAYMRKWRIALFAAVMVPATFLAFSWARPPIRFELRDLLSAGAALAVIVTGYIFFVLFIRGQANTTFRLLTEMSLAQQIHASLTKPIQLQTARFEVFSRSDASSEMGGDVVDVVEVDGRLGLFLGDVSGHGVRAGVVMGMVKSAIRMKLKSSSAIDELLRDLNDVIGELAHPGMFVTFAAMRSNTGGSAQAVLAGHLPILHYRAAERTWVEIETDHPPLGVIAGESYSVCDVRFSSGDLFVLLTDGLMEVFRSDGTQLGWQGIRRVLEGIEVAAPLAQISDHVFKAARDFGPQLDDQSILIVRAL